MNDTVIEGIVFSIVGTVVVVVIPLAYKLRSVVRKHKTLLGKVAAVIKYFQTHPTTDTQLEKLVGEVEQLITMIK